MIKRNGNYYSQTMITIEIRDNSPALALQVIWLFAPKAEKLKNLLRELNRNL